MFTGIIARIGQITGIQTTGGDIELSIACDDAWLDDVNVGDSISVNGVCLTARTISGRTFIADVSSETLQTTAMKQYSQGGLVNLEKALRLDQRLGGHLVSGHVDAIAKLIDQRNDGRSIRMRFLIANDLSKYIAVKGSVCLDGVSLTVNSVSETSFTVNLVPHTLQETTLGDWKLGQQVNIEVDMIARYVERLVGQTESLHEKLLNLQTPLSQ